MLQAICAASMAMVPLPQQGSYSGRSAPWLPSHPAAASMAGLPFTFGFVAKEAVISSWAQTYAVEEPAEGDDPGTLGERITADLRRSEANLAEAQRMTIRQSLVNARLHLWDEKSRRLLGWADARRAMAQ